ncbi:hypothetical protein H112_01678 [Trichophyton rubrum D6]|uniref:Uncharacterized protein n=3 Tax=Trichophyton TaxID=5550 RepID=F2SXL6_TRIRC|nr:uncharacterized protein TERG_07309 [Trichophyton rubrum CBS 118892]EZF26139.1 hypothetical protein H100_01674 [Trichophyton rubrum MR850]EZF45147.1 hypothetical protein H102_01666 [Trichophyton rubrum CBS 100081]EZF55780.1 hypothetical protein H103_01680 [Trichophyton rubrum CBS 288.86]EZF66395.1 hypothetical protein H104_01655 [Trichophyton rubrum CBS 289.86]EZF77036.1 hypothetical protein H105_01682 [Trichophyton soudanense CBS 452.61]EZF87689.1 hypothetical protein H110_01678 [Trichophy
MSYGQVGTPYAAPSRNQTGPYFSPGYAYPPYHPRNRNGTPRPGWNGPVPRYRRYNNPQVFMRPVLSYPRAIPRYRNRRQNEAWTGWGQSQYPPPTPALLPASLHDRSAERNSVSASPGRVPRVVPDASPENAFSEIMNGAFDSEKSPLSLGKTMADIDTTPSSDRLLQQSNPFGYQKQQQGKRAASSQITAPAETYKKANSSSSGGSSRFGYESNTFSPGESELSTLAHLIQQNTKQSAELQQLLFEFLKQKQEELNSHSVSSSRSDNVQESTDENDGMLSPGPHVANGGGESPDPPHGSKNNFRGHMIEGVESASDSRSNSDSESKSTVPTSVDARSLDGAGYPKDLQEKSLISAIGTLHHLSSSKDSDLSEDSGERKNRFERPPRKGRYESTDADNRRTWQRHYGTGLCQRAPSPGGSPSGKQVEFDFLPKSASPGSPHSSTDSVRHVQTLLTPSNRYSSRPSFEMSSPRSSSLDEPRTMGQCVPSELISRYYHNYARPSDHSYESWESSPRSP